MLARNLAGDGEELPGAAIAADRLRLAASKPFGGLAEAPLSVTISVGVTAFRPDTADAKALLTEADQALYASKQGGRNRVTIFTPPA